MRSFLGGCCYDELSLVEITGNPKEKRNTEVGWQEII